MAKHLDEKKKYIVLALISICLVIFTVIMMLIIGGALNKDSQNNNTQNNIEQQQDNNNVTEDDVLRVILDPEETENQEQETQPEEDSNKEANVNKETTTTNDKSKYYIKINNQANVVTVYQQDTKGNYTVPVKAMICSIGDATPTSGVYKTTDKYTWRLLQGDVYGQYAVRITGHILFHSVPYTAKSKNSLEWWEYDKLGTKASLGCIRLKVEDAKWIYDHCEKGTQVEFYYDSDPGPLGKPTAKKISSYSEELKNWDPTDPDSRNPWKTYKESEIATETEEEVTPEEVPTVSQPEDTTQTPDQNQEQTPSDTPEEREELEEKEEETEQDKEVKPTEQIEALSAEQEKIEI